MRFRALIFAFAVWTLTLPAAPAQATSGGISSAEGFATSTTPAGTRYFAFAVAQRPNGSATGAAFVRNPNTGLTFVLSLNCFQRQGNEALVGGVVTQATNPAIVGSTFVFGIRDKPDTITFTLTNGDGSLTCDNALSQTGEQSLDSFVTDFALPALQEAVVMTPSD